MECPDCKSHETDIMEEGCSIYPEMGKPTYCCRNCRTIFAPIKKDWPKRF